MKTRTRSARKKNVRNEKRRRRSAVNRINTAAAAATLMTMLTSVVQVPVSSDAVQGPVNKSTAARRARAQAPSGMEALHIRAEVTARRRDMERRARAMVAKSLLGTEVNKAPDTGVKSSLAMDVKNMVVTLAVMDDSIPQGTGMIPTVLVATINERNDLTRVIVLVDDMVRIPRNKAVVAAMTMMTSMAGRESKSMDLAVTVVARVARAAMVMRVTAEGTETHRSTTKAS